MKNDREFFEGLGAPLPPRELRARVLAAAGPVLARESRGRWTKIWESPAFRISWAVTVVLLALGHLALSIEPSRSRSVPVSASGGNGSGSDFARAMSLPKIDPATLKWTALSDEEWLDRADRLRDATPPAPRKEKTS